MGEHAWIVPAAFSLVAWVSLDSGSVAFLDEGSFNRSVADDIESRYHINVTTRGFAEVLSGVVTTWQPQG